MGGFECADHLNAFGERVDLIKLTGHDRLLKADYALLSALNIKTVREGIRWSQVEKAPYVYDWTGVEHIVETAELEGIQVIWDICHFGFPADLTPLHPMFARRFAHLCRSFVLKYRSLVPHGSLILTPINEVSFLSWLGGDVRGTVPYGVGQGGDVKYHLMKAYIEGVEMIKEVDPGARIMTTEPLINIIAGDATDPGHISAAFQQHQAQFETLEILCGNSCAELRGKPEYLDILGVNFYFNNQWTCVNHQTIPWDETPVDPRWRSFHSLVEEVFRRYGRPIVLSETSHPGEERPKWIRNIGVECLSILQAGVPLQGICYYPILDRPDWDHPSVWHHSGLWDIHDPETLARTAHVESIREIADLNRKLSIHQKAIPRV